MLALAGQRVERVDRAVLLVGNYRTDGVELVHR
jgi:hypothetical protein